MSSSVDDEDVSQPKPSKLKKKMQATPRAAAVAAPASVFAEESKMDRLERLAGILELTTDPSTFDEKRALKTLDKIKEVHNNASYERYIVSSDNFIFRPLDRRIASSRIERQRSGENHDVNQGPFR